MKTWVYVDGFNLYFGAVKGTLYKWLDIHTLCSLLPFVFTDQHAYAAGTEYFSDLAGLPRVDWPLLQSRNFKTDDADPGKQLRYHGYQSPDRSRLIPIHCAVRCRTFAAEAYFWNNRRATSIVSP